MNSAVVIPVELPKPTDYMAIYRIADAELSKLRHRATGSDTQLCLHLSPGTPAMAAVWALLGKTRDPAKFLETFAGKSWVTDIPFDLTIDVLPELLRDPDCHWQHLAAEGPQDVAGFEDIAGESRVICDAVGRAKRAALRAVSILLLGESGTGKEMFAHAIHKASPRRDRPFVAINCATLSKTLLESSAAADSAMSKGRVPERIVIGRTRSSRPPVNRGELLCTFSAGAYRTTMSSNYNSRPRAIELLIDGDQVKVIRRREIYDDLIAAELV